MIPNHVAILVPSVRKAADYLRQFHFEIGEEKIWEGEGTREIYVGLTQGNSLLLMEPIQPGAYLRAMHKRGPGVHHLAVDILNLDHFLSSISGSGWYVHPASIRAMRATQSVFLTRPGFPALIEIQERDVLNVQKLFVEKVTLPIPASLAHLAQAIGLDEVLIASQEEPELRLNGTTVKLKNLF